MRILALMGVILVAIVMLGWYWPLWRAHRQLRAEYLRRSDSEQRVGGQLASNQVLLRQIQSERDRLRSSQQARERQAEAQRVLLVKVQEQLASRLSTLVELNQIHWERVEEQLIIDLAGPRLLPPAEVDLSRAGRSVACQIGEVLGKFEELEVRVIGRGTDVDANSPGLRGLDTGWDVAAVRASRAAYVLTSCGIPSQRLRIEGDLQKPGMAALSFGIVPRRAATSP